MLKFLVQIVWFFSLEQIYVLDLVLCCCSASLVALRTTRLAMLNKLARR
uniref:Uncharacterized protein n=1 Tax=Arundo donax TaxID=35708 RepID=A0A0A9BIM0_ARUDO